jgi:hypothetical protein
MLISCAEENHAMAQKAAENGINAGKIGYKSL